LFSYQRSDKAFLFSLQLIAVTHYRVLPDRSTAVVLTLVNRSSSIFHFAECQPKWQFCRSWGCSSIS